MNPWLKVTFAGLATGLIAFLSMLTASTSWDGALVRSAVAAGVGAALQYVAPIVLAKVDPHLALVLNALALAVVAFLSMLSASTSWDGSALRAAAAAALAALLQYATPYSPVGVGGKGAHA